MKRRSAWTGFLAALLLSQCGLPESEPELASEKSEVELVVLGTTQDAGSPQIGCARSCCAALSPEEGARRMVVSLGLIDRSQGRKYMIEATPDLPAQLDALNKLDENKGGKLLDGLFLTHAHIGHYSGLMYLGKEAMDAQQMPVHVMPRMASFLSSHGPWEQLVERGNIRLEELEEGQWRKLSERLSIRAFRVPHRDEYSETVGFEISGPNKKVLFIPDIDKWEKWSKDIAQEIKAVDLAFLDATFFSGAELPKRDMSEIPHPSVRESMERLSALSEEDKRKVHFIHFNHTNPLLKAGSPELQLVREMGFQVAQYGSVHPI